MTEQQKITALYERLTPDKKSVFLLMMQTIANMMVAMVTLADQSKNK